MTHRHTPPPPQIVTCACDPGCGLSWDYMALPYHRRGRKFHPDCPNHVFTGKQRKPAAPVILTCGCGTCGLTFQAFRGRKYHPECPIYDDIQKAQAKRLEAKRVRVKPAEDDEPISRDYCVGKHRKGKRCHVCEGMSWVRGVAGCPNCKQPYAPEPPPEVRMGTGRSNYDP